MIARVDALLGRVTMYRLVILCLVGLSVVAAALAGADLAVPFSLAGVDPLLRPVAMLASAAVLLVWALVTSLVAGRLQRTRPHLESTVITALLLFVILPPTLDPAALLVLALAAVLAVASKHLLVVRGRHLLNPAAFGAFAIGVPGLGFSAWWLATPLLLPFVAVAGILVLWRTRRAALAGTFAIVALVALVVRYAAVGETAATAVSTAILSLPLVFFACFMLTEPLTLPPRRRQQLAEAAVVGVLFAVPFSFPGPTVGPFAFGLYATPEFALLIGNLLAFAVAQRRGIRLDFVGRRRLSPSSWELEFRPRSPVRFAPGQYLEITVPHRGADARGTRRTFSVASPPVEDGPLRIGIRMPADRPSSFKRALLDLEPGSRIDATGVGGDFLLPDDVDTPLLMVAGGIGVTPFVAQLGHDAAERDAVLVYSVTSADDIPYADELERSGVRVLLVSPVPPSDLPASWTWLGSGRLDAERLLAAVPDATMRAVYLSGPPALIAALRPALRRAGARRIRTDAFLGY